MIIIIIIITISFSVVRASVLCVRGSRTKWRSLGLEDGAAIDLN